MRNRLGAFPIGPVVGDDYLPLDPVDAMRRGHAHRVPLIVGTNAEEGRLFTRFLRLLPTTEPMVEALLADMDPGARECITAAYPGYPDRSACIRLGGDFAFSSAAWQIAEAHGNHAPAYLYRYDYAPRRCTGRVWGRPTPPNCSPSSTSTAPGSAACSPLPPTGARRCGSATMCNGAGGRSATPECPATAGRFTPPPSVPSWSSTAGLASNTIPTPSAGWHGRASPRHVDGWPSGSSVVLCGIRRCDSVNES